MKFKAILFGVALSGFFLFGCTPRNQNGSNLIHIDVTRSYPVKEIRLEEVANIEFLQLEMHDDFLFMGAPRVITSNKIIFGQFNGDILIFSRDGKPISKFNRRGGSPQDYVDIQRLIYDEATDEIFVLSSGSKIMVYSSAGEFRRRLSLLEGSSATELVSFDSESLLLHDNWDTYPVPFVLISKKNGEIILKIDMPGDEKVQPFYMRQDDRGISIVTAPSHWAVQYRDGFLLTDFSLDTVYFFSQNRELSPILTRSPAIQSMNTVTYLNSFIEAGNYQFLSAVTVRNEGGRLPRTYLMRDKRTGSIYRQRITFDDFRGREITLSPTTIANTQNSRLGLISLDLTELQDANDEGRLSGRLKELVENSDEDGNNVFMLLHFK